MRITTLLFLVPVFISCSKSKHPLIPVLLKWMNECFTPLRQVDNQLSDTFFFIGPELDSTNMEILAPCDCCASNLVFVNDTLFVYESLCLEEDVYSKGNYVRSGSLIILEVQSPSVSHIHMPGLLEADESWETNPHKTNYVALNLSELNSRMVLSIKYDQAMTDYGLGERPGSYVPTLKKEGVWKKLGLQTRHGITY